MVSMEGEPMARIDRRRFKWYLAQDLAESVGVDEESGAEIMRLKFVPKGYGQRGEAGHLALCKNSCVACGDEECRRTSLVPEYFRAHLPMRYRSHNPRDIVQLCKACKAKLNLASRTHTATLFKAAGIDPQAPRFSKKNWVGDKARENIRVRSAATALLRRRSSLPETRVTELQARIETYLGRMPEADDIQLLAEMETEGLVHLHPHVSACDL